MQIGSPQQGTREPDVVIRLTTINKSSKDEVRYSFTTGRYEAVQDEDPLLDLLTLPSRVVHKSEAPLSKLLMLPTLPPKPPSPAPESPGKAARITNAGMHWQSFKIPEVINKESYFQNLLRSAL